MILSGGILLCTIMTGEANSTYNGDAKDLEMFRNISLQENVFSRNWVLYGKILKRKEWKLAGGKRKGQYTN